LFITGKGYDGRRKRMAEVVAIIGKVIFTIVLLFVFIIGLLVAIDPTDIGIMIFEAFKIAIPNPMVDQFILELRIIGVVSSIAGIVGFLMSIFFLWKE
jgi:cytochrome b561